MFIFVVCVVFVIYFVFSGRLILPQGFAIGPFTVRYYGVIMASAAGLGLYLSVNSAEKFKIKKKSAEDLLFWAVIGGFLGARLYHVFSSLSYYLQNPLGIFKVWNGGMSIFGAVFGGMLALWLAKNFYKASTPFLNILNWLAPALVLGQAVGRFGNLFNYEVLGYPTGLPWGMFVPLNFRPIGFESHAFFQPFFLYEALGSVAIYFILKKIFNFQPKAPLFFWYLLLYNSLRFCLEFTRTDSVYLEGVRQNAAVSLLLAVLAAVFLVYFRKNVQTP